MTIKGFSFSAVKAGIRYPNRLDLGLIFAQRPCVTAGVFTTNVVKAAPVVIDQRRLKAGVAQAVLVNSGCANACTGVEGMEAALTTSQLLSARLGIDNELVQLASTGVIGEQLNLDAFRQHIPYLVDSLSPDGIEKLAEAILTTDTRKKIATETITLSGKPVNFLGVAKGAGMIMPNMATMLGFVCTDGVVAQQLLRHCLREATRRTFNRITIDGDTSTNDMVLVMASGEAGNKPIDEGNPAEQQVFRDGLETVLKSLAEQIVADGEGATKSVTIRVIGASQQSEAENIGRIVANSLLVKTAFFGEDANWGRILAAMGRSGVNFDPDLVDIYFDTIQLVDKGVGLGSEAETAASEVLKKTSFTLTIDINNGSATAEILGCDLSLDYVKINADYRS